MESQRKLLQFSMQYWKNRPPEDFLKVQQEFANLKTEEIMQKVLENAKSVLNDEKFNFPSVKDLPRPSRDDIIRFQEVSKLKNSLSISTFLYTYIHTYIQYTSIIVTLPILDAGTQDAGYYRWW